MSESVLDELGISREELREMWHGQHPTEIQEAMYRRPLSYEQIVERGLATSTPDNVSEQRGRWLRQWAREMDEEEARDALAEVGHIPDAAGGRHDGAMREAFGDDWVEEVRGYAAEEGEAARVGRAAREAQRARRQR